MKTIAFKLVLRSWWRNKTFSVISIVSLAIGIACTNLLAVFTIHEYGIEKGNPNKEHIWVLSQDWPMKNGEKTIYAGAEIPGMLKDKYTELDKDGVPNFVLSYSSKKGCRKIRFPALDTKFMR